MEAMTSRERIVAALEAQPIDRTPWSPFLAYVWERFDEEIRAMGQPAFLREVGADPLWRGAPGPVRAIGPEAMESRWEQDNAHKTLIQTTPVGMLTSRWRYSEGGGTWFLVEHPLKRPEDYRVQMWIEEHTRLEYVEQPAIDHLAGAGAEGLSLGMLIPRSKSAFQILVEHHVGTEELVYALADYPEVVEQLLGVMIEQDLRAVQMAAMCPLYDYWITWEDSSTQNYSPAQYDRYIGPEIRQWVDILRPSGKKYIQHACGHVRDLVARMAAGGVLAVESISPPPTGNVTIRQARQTVGERLGIVGGIEPTHFLQLPLDRLGAYVEQVIEEAAGGPFVLANSDSCPPGVTLEKFKLVGEVVRAN